VAGAAGITVLSESDAAFLAARLGGACGSAAAARVLLPPLRADMLSLPLPVRLGFRA
jgi:hypothetical protein